MRLDTPWAYNIHVSAEQSCGLRIMATKLVWNFTQMILGVSKVCMAAEQEAPEQEVPEQEVGLI